MNRACGAEIKLNKPQPSVPGPVDQEDAPSL